MGVDFHGNYEAEILFLIIVLNLNIFISNHAPISLINLIMIIICIFFNIYIEIWDFKQNNSTLPDLNFENITSV